MPRVVPLSHDRRTFSLSTYNHQSKTRTKIKIKSPAEEPKSRNDSDQKKKSKDSDSLDEEWAQVFKPPRRTSSCPYLSSLIKGQMTNRKPLEEISRDVASGSKDENAGILIPGLTNDLAMVCLAKVPYGVLGPARGVSTMWRRVLASEEFHKMREGEGTTGEVFCVCLGVQNIKGRRGVVFEALDFRSHTWFQLPPLYLSFFSIWKPGGRFDNFSGYEIVSVGSKLLLLGGTFHVDSLRDQRRNREKTKNGSCDVWCFDSVIFSWTALSSMPQFRSNFSVSAIDENRIIVAGSSFNSSASIFDLRNNVWREIESMPYPGDICRGVTVNGFFYAIWHRHPFHGARSAYIYDIENGNWSTIPHFFPSMGSLETSQSMAVLDGVIYATQGERQASIGGELSVLRHKGDLNGADAKNMGNLMPHERHLNAMTGNATGGESWKPIARLPRKLRERRGEEEYNLEGHFLAGVDGKLIIVQTVVIKKIVDGIEEIRVFGEGETQHRIGFMSILSPPWWEDKKNRKNMEILAWEVKDLQISSGIVACSTLRI